MVRLVFLTIMGLASLCYAAEPTLVPYYTPTMTPNAPYAAWPTPVLDNPNQPTPTHTPTATETPTITNTPIPPIIDRIGGTVVLENVGRTFFKLLRENPRIGYYFKELSDYRPRQLEFERHFVALLCELSGGDCEYDGRTMKQSHKGMDISAKHVRIFIKVLQQALEKEGVNREVGEELLERVRLLEKDVIDTTPKKKIHSAPPSKPAIRGRDGK